MNKLVIAEKPSMASDIARVIGAANKENGYYEGNGYYVTWAYGHLIELYNREAESGKWKDVALPITSALVLRPKDGVGKQLAIIDKLSKQSSELVCACDAGREGELIFRLIVQYLKINKPTVRLWISSLTDTSIKTGFASLKPSSSYDNLFLAAKARSESDWYVGVNATRALTLAASTGDVFSLGRVQTPTLSMICSRYLEHVNFVAEPFWILEASCKVEDQHFKMQTERYQTLSLAESDLTKCNGEVLLITSVERKKRKENPPLLYDLTGLQKEASRCHGITPDKTLEIAQSLYEKKVLSYPRTGSSYIPEDVFASIPKLINLAANLNLPLNIESYNTGVLSRYCVNDSKVTDHHALLPTEVIPDLDSLTKLEQTIYKMVVIRLFQAFHNQCIKEDVSVLGCAGSIQYFAKGSTVLVQGWREVVNKKRMDGDEEQGEELPSIAEGDTLMPLFEISKKMTKAKPLLTDATLLAYMETAGRELDDPEMRGAMLDSGLGTPATRDAIIKNLIDKKYIVRENKAVIPTPKGLETYAIVATTPIGSPILTGEWEAALAKIGSIKDYNFFMEQVFKYTNNVVNILSKITPMEKKQSELVPKCPKCGQTMHFFAQGLGCTKECGFVVWREIASKKLTDAQLFQIVEEGESPTLSGFKSKTGKYFSAALKIVDFKVSFVFNSNK